MVGEGFVGRPCTTRTRTRTLWRPPGRGGRQHSTLVKRAPTHPPTNQPATPSGKQHAASPPMSLAYWQGGHGEQGSKGLCLLHPSTDSSHAGGRSLVRTSPPTPMHHPLLQAAVLLVQEALPHLLRRPGASIAFVSSVTAFK